MQTTLFLELDSFKEEVIGKQLELKLFTEQEKYRVDNIINKANEVIKTLKLTTK
jgi:hypothetical protein